MNIEISITCDDTTCIGCKYLNYINKTAELYCKIFKEKLNVVDIRPKDGKYKALRCDECIKSTKRKNDV